MWMRILALACGYFIAGRLGLLLAIPPGFATAFWPASGVAVAGLLLFGVRAWPGVLVGSFLINVGTTFDTSGPMTILLSLALPLGIGAGAALQAIVGAYLVHRFVGFPDPLNREQDIAALLVIAGPLSCLISATAGVALLWSTGRIQAEELAFSWWTWWVGDTIGAFLVTPLVIVWAARPERDWPRRPIIVSAPLGILAGLVVILFLYTDRQEQERLRHAFEFQSETLTRALENHLEYAGETLNAMRSFHGNQPNRVDQQRFAKLAKQVLARRGIVQAISWAPFIDDAERSAFEKAARQDGAPGFEIRQLKDGQFVSAARRDEYYPILYREPLPENPQGLGFDVGSELDRREAMRRAADSGEATAAAPITPAQKGTGEKTILIFLPIYQENSGADPSTERRQAVLGYVIAVLRVGRLVDLAWQGYESDDIDSWLYDESAPPPKQLVYHHSPMRTETDAALADTPTAAPGLKRRTTIDAFGRRWALWLVPTPAYLAAQRSMLSWTVLAGGMLFTGLLGAVLLVVTGREALIAGIVEERTAELAHANTALTQEVRERAQAEDALRAREESLRQSEERFRLLVEGTIGYAIFMLDPRGHVVSWNAGAERLHGYRADEIIGQHFTRFYSDEEARQDKPAQVLATAAATGRSEDEGWRIRKDGGKYWANAIITALRDADGNLKGFSKITRDLTERMRVEAKLEESRRFVERIAEMVPSILYVYDLKEERNIFVNQRIESILGYSAEETKRPGAPLPLDHYHPDDLPKVEWANEQCQMVEDGAVIETEYRMRHANGQWRWLHSRATIFVRDSEDNPSQILGTLQDVTDQKRLEQEVLEVASSEQRRIGQVLHDGTGQELTGLCMLAGNLADALHEHAPEEAQLARRIAQGLQRALGQVRALSRGLIPVEVDAEGLMAALTELTTRIGDMHSVRCIFECLEPVPIEDNYAATQLFRIAQEAITNAIKHGQAGAIRVSLESKGHYVTLKIADDGKGLPTSNGHTDGMGLRIMRYRAGQVGAQFSVRPGPMRGTIVSCTLFRGITHDGQQAE